MDIRVKVVPKSSKTELAGYLPDGTWKVKVSAAPEKAKPTAQCEFIAAKLGVSKSKVRRKTNPRRLTDLHPQGGAGALLLPAS
jgi:uncharacterized protein YggU (UPF0235/DUF167 family)